MVQALAFAEIFGGLIVMYAGYKGHTIAEVVKGEVTKETPTAPLGSSWSTTATAGEGGPPTASFAEGAQGKAEVAAKGGAFGPAPSAPLTWKSLEEGIKAHKLTPA